MVVGFITTYTISAYHHPLGEKVIPIEKVGGGVKIYYIVLFKVEKHVYKET
jgi:hypothetical protein